MRKYVIHKNTEQASKRQCVLHHTSRPLSSGNADTDAVLFSCSTMLSSSSSMLPALLEAIAAFTSCLTVINAYEVISMLNLGLCNQWHIYHWATWAMPPLPPPPPLNSDKFLHMAKMQHQRISILRKIVKIVATRFHILRLKCTKFNFGWGSTPDPTWRAYSAPQTP